MIKYFITVLQVLALFNFAFAQSQQIFQIDTIHRGGNVAKAINLLIMGDGYTQAQLSQFDGDVRRMTDSLFAGSPFREYKNFFNVIAVRVVSNQSGASVTGGAQVDNYFGSAFVSASSAGLAPNYTRVRQVATRHVADWDEIGIMVNTTTYGGNALLNESIMVFSLSRTWAVALMRHEFGHSFADLEDEYWNGIREERANSTGESRATHVKWRNWLGINGIGQFVYSQGSPNWFRPHQNCLMNDMGRNFCSVCIEHTIQVINRRVETPLVSRSPNNASVVVNGTQEFALDLLLPIPNTLNIRWTINGVPFAAGNDKSSINLSTANLTSGQSNVLTATIVDTTDLMRLLPTTTNRSRTTATWNVSVGQTITNCPDCGQNPCVCSGTFIRDRQPRDGRFGVLLDSAVVSDSVKISVITPEASVITKTTIFDVLGNVVFTTYGVRAGFKPTSTDDAVIWNLRTNTGRNVVSGTYIVIVEAIGVSGATYRYFARIGIKR